jgi:hypothetical protein
MVELNVRKFIVQNGVDSVDMVVTGPMKPSSYDQYVTASTSVQGFRVSIHNFDKRPRGRPKARYQDTVRKDMEVAGLQDGDELDRVTWRAKTRKADSAQKREKR